MLAPAGFRRAAAPLCTQRPSVLKLLPSFPLIISIVSRLSPREETVITCVDPRQNPSNPTPRWNPYVYMLSRWNGYSMQATTGKYCRWLLQDLSHSGLYLNFRLVPSWLSPGSSPGDCHRVLTCCTAMTWVLVHCPCSGRRLPLYRYTNTYSR